MIWKKIVGVLSLVVIATIMSRSLLTSPARTAGDQPPALAQQPIPQPVVAQVNPPSSPVPKPPVAAAKPALPAIGAGPDGKEVLAESDGKTVLPGDGKETIGKETLPPVGELVGQRTDSVNPGHSGPPIEYLNNTPPSSNPLLTPPNPVNVSGPVVSAETRSPP